MNDSTEPTPVESEPEPVAEMYEPPIVEMVVTADELEREIHYAGTIMSAA